MKRTIRPVVIPIGPSIAYVELTQGQWSLIDSDDAERVGKYNWHAWYSRNTDSFYARTQVWSGPYEEVVIRLNVLIIGQSEGFIVDHKSGNTIDNRRANLRHATPSQNTINGAIRKDNTSGIKGVRWNKNLQKWVAEICINGKRIHLGCFDDSDSAREAYRQAAEKLHGEFRRAA